MQRIVKSRVFLFSTAAAILNEIDIEMLKAHFFPYVKLWPCEESTIHTARTHASLAYK